MSYDKGNLLTWSTLSPTGTGTETYTWTYSGIERGNRPLTYSPPGAGTQNASLAYSYVWATRAAGIWGEKPSQITVASSQIDLVNSSTQNLVTWQTLDTMGRPDTEVDAAGTNVKYHYKASGVGVDLLEEVERMAVGTLGTKKVVFTQDDYGRVSNIKDGTAGNFAETAFAFDAFGRTVTETVDPGGSQPTMVTTLRRDIFDNVAVVLRNNLDYNGQGPKYDDGTGSPRADVRSDYNFYFDRLLDAYVDRRALPEPEDLANPTGGSSPWLLRYQVDYDLEGRVETMTAPNGTVTSYVWDGYGTLYKSVGDPGTTPHIAQELGRYYFDSDLVLKELRGRVKVGSTLTWASIAYSRNHAGKGNITQATFADGVQEVMTYDQMGRPLRTEVFDAASLRKKFV